MPPAESARAGDRVTALDEAVVYVAIGLALASALFAAGAGAGSASLGLTGAFLALAGATISWRFRLRPAAGVLAGILLGLLVAAAFLLLVHRELQAEDTSIYVARGELGVLLSLLMGALALALSFTLLRYEVIAFSLVPALATFGLVAGQGRPAPVGAAFLLFLPAALVALGHGMVVAGAVAAAGRGRSGWRSPRWRPRHWTALAALVGLVLALAYLLSLPIAYVFSLYRWQLLGRVFSSAPGAGYLMRSVPRSSTVLPVGRGPVSLSKVPLLTIWGEPAPLWRGQAFDHFTGQGWLRSETLEEADPSAPPPPALPPLSLSPDGLPVLDLTHLFPPQPGGRLHPHLVRVEAELPLIFYSPGQLHRLAAPDLPSLPLHLDTYGCLEARGATSERGGFYQVVSSPLEIRLSRRGDKRLLSPPPGDYYLRIPFSSRRVADLARQVAGDEPTPERRLSALIAYLQRNCVYTLDAPATPRGRDAADNFLFRSKRGYCDLFGTALALMGRAVGIPTRLVSGFAYGELLPDGSGRPPPPRPAPPPGGVYQMRECDAHIWVEAYLPSWGWVTADATPVGEDAPMPPLRHSLLRLRFFWQDYPLAASFLALTALGLAIFLLLRLRGLRPRLALVAAAGPDPRALVVRSYALLLAFLRRRGQPRQPSQTPLEFLAALRTLSAPPPRPHPSRAARRARTTADSLQAALPAIASLTQLFLLARYSPAPVSDESSRLAWDHLLQARRSLRGR